MNQSLASRENKSGAHLGIELRVFTLGRAPNSQYTNTEIFLRWTSTILQDPHGQQSSTIPSSCACRSKINHLSQP